MTKENPTVQDILGLFGGKAVGGYDLAPDQIRERDREMRERDRLIAYLKAVKPASDKIQ